MTRPDVACLCIDVYGPDTAVHVAETVYGEHADLVIEQFIERHSGPGHFPVNPAKDWHGKAGEFRQYVERVRRELDSLDTTEGAPGARTIHDTDTIDPGGKL